MRTFVGINKKNLIHNFLEFRRILPDTKISAVVKADAYGHGAPLVVKVLDKYANSFQVDSLREFEEIKNITKKPIHIFGYLENSEIQTAVKDGAYISIFSLSHAKQIDKVAKKKNKKVNAYITFDAFLGREGMTKDLLLNDVNKICALKNINILGMYAHFANIEDDLSLEHAQKQIKEYNEAFEMLQINTKNKLQKFISASSGAILESASVIEKGDIVRVGIALYGLWPSQDMQRKYNKKVSILPVMSFETHVAQVKDLPKGRTISYGLTYTTPKKMKVAVVPVGYSDGYDRRFSNKSYVLINDNKCPVLGRVCMNMMVVDVSNAGGVKEGDRVVVLGTYKKNTITAEDLARIAGSINYEIVTRINTDLPRILV
ncbi:alanine racemase [Candidatus Nomurabacteria bacterium]|nr:alanine racemase [Candidatus Nomurabacteria bacterium]